MFIKQLVHKIKQTIIYVQTKIKCLLCVCMHILLFPCSIFYVQCVKHLILIGVTLLMEELRAETSHHWLKMIYFVYETSKWWPWIDTFDPWSLSWDGTTTLMIQTTRLDHHLIETRARNQQPLEIIPQYQRWCWCCRTLKGHNHKFAFKNRRQWASEMGT